MKYYTKVEEMCPHCDYTNEFRYKGKMVAKCKECGKQILLCSICDCDEDYNNCANCPYKSEVTD